MSMVSVQELPEAGFAVIVTAQTAEAGVPWWRTAARSPAWIVEHLSGDEIEGLDFDLVRATRECRSLSSARRHADRAAKALGRHSGGKNLLIPDLPNTLERKESPDARTDPQEGAIDRD